MFLKHCRSAPPQGLCCCSSFCLETLPLGIHRAYFLTFFRFLLKCHLVRSSLSTLSKIITFLLSLLPTSLIPYTLLYFSLKHLIPPGVVYIYLTYLLLFMIHLPPSLECRFYEGRNFALFSMEYLALGTMLC